jgi:hypothetical protein
MESEVEYLGRRLLSALRRLGFFPFTFFYTVIYAAIRVVQLRQGHEILRVGEVTGETASLPRSVMLWLDRVATGLPEPRFDICLRLPREADDDNLHDVFSVLLTSPRLRSVGLYWDSSSLANDLRLWQAKQGRNDPTGGATPYEDLGALSLKQLQEFFEVDHVRIVLPVAVTRDAQTLLKRQAGAAYAVCLNVPVEHRSLIAAVQAMRPDTRFFDLAPALPTTEAANSQSLHGYGLNLHERMALVQVADAYVGSFDELGCAALAAKRPAVLLGGGTGEQPDRISRGDVAVWFPGPVEATTLAKVVLQFLSRQIGPAENLAAGRSGS